MAELEVSVSYRTKPARVGLLTMMCLMPLWAIVIPFCLGLFLVLLVKQPVALIPAVFALGTLLAVPILSVLVAAICEDDRLLITKEGLAFPLLFLPELQFRRERLWSDLSHASLSSDFERGKHIMMLRFKSGGSASIDLSNCSKSDVEQLLLATEVWGKECERTPQLIAYQNQVQNESRGVDNLSYTQMWEEELSRRFSATSFVPLDPDHVLQGGRYKVVRQLAFGGLSAIYLAQRNENDLVIVKEAVVPTSADEQSRKKAAELFEREARFLIRLDHPNIAKVYDSFAENGRNYLILEYIRGQDLRAFVKQNGAQPEKEVLNWSLQIASILDYLHSQEPPIIHRDLTPDNLVRKEDDSVVLIDFGAANEFVGTATGTLVGKQAYIAPEQLRGKATTASDIYALGGTVYFLLTGKDPEALSASHPLDVKLVSRKLDEVVASCTEMEEEDRPKARALSLSFAELYAETADGHPDAAGVVAGE